MMEEFGQIRERFGQLSAVRYLMTVSHERIQQRRNPYMGGASWRAYAREMIDGVHIYQNELEYWTIY